MKPFHAYLLRCADGSYYCGHTDDIEARMQQHFHGEIGYTAERKPVELVWQGEFETREGALAFEQQVKGWSRAKKEALVAGDWEQIKALAPSRERSGRTGTTLARAEPVEAKEVHAGPSTSSVPSTRSGQSGPSTSSGRTDHVATLLGSPGPAQRRAMAKAITLLESTRADHRAQAEEMLTGLLPHTGKSFRLAISGVPGVGKSTFIDALGLFLIERGHRVAVLTIDPSSTVSGGSILGDKTRMERLSVNDRAYIRPSPSSGTLGGVAEKTREAMLVCEAAGYDIVIVETVGVGQSETAAAGMTDMFVLLQLPNAGDDLQAIKKGVMELADLVVINKADLDADAATRARAQITSALRIFGQHGHPDHSRRDAGVWQPQVLQLSALQSQGLDEFWDAVQRFRTLQESNGRWAERRRQQALGWMWERIDAGLKREFRQHPEVKRLLPAMLSQVSDGQLPASVAARRLLDAWHAPSAVDDTKNQRAR
jgi:LAO/AO transport system kinase